MVQKSVALLCNPQDEFILDLIPVLRKEGWQVHVFCHEQAPSSIKTKATIHRLPVSVKYPLTYLSFTASFFRLLFLRPQVVHAHGISSYGVYTALMRRFFRIKPLVMSFTGPDLLDEGSKGMTGWAVRHTIHMADRLLAKSDLRETLIKMGAKESHLVEQSRDLSQVSLLYLSLLRKRASYKGP